MAQSKITLIGFYNYYKAVDKDLFANLALPVGIDKDVVVNNILLRGGEFEVLFSNPEFLENMMSVWSNKYNHTFERWYLALTEDYNPLHNYDRHEEYSDNRIDGETVNRNNNRNTNRTMSNNENGSRGENVTALDHSISSGTGETTNSVSAYDSSNYSPHDKSNSESTGNNVSTATTNVTGTDNRNSTTSDLMQDINNDNSNRLLNSKIEHTAHLYGNIGLTTSQMMASDEIKLRKDFNIYNLIADLFISEFCIYTY